MTSLATGFVSKKLKERIQSRAKQYEPEDPFYVYMVVDGKEKRKKREPPPGLTKQQAKNLRKIQRRAHYLDKGIKIGPFRVGWTFFIGLIPFAGDATDAALNYFLVVKPSKKNFELPPWLVSQMLLNNAISAGVGLVPFAGDIMLAVWRANSRNAKLLEEYLRVLGEAQISQGIPNLTKGDNHHQPGASNTKNKQRASPAAFTTHPGQSDARTDAQEVIRLSSGQIDTSTATTATPAEVEKARSSRFSFRGKKNGAATTSAATPASGASGPASGAAA